MARKKIQCFAEKLVELSNVAPENEVFDTLINALSNKIKSVNGKEENKIVKKIQTLVEKHYQLQRGSLDNSFKRKDRDLTEAKFMWVVITLHVFKNDRNKVERLISNGITRQKVYTCKRTFEELKDKIPHEKAIKETYKIIIQSYE
jgi:hypothetical protein